MAEPSVSPEPLRVVACPHPFRAERHDYALPAGLTVRQILQAVQPRPELLRGAHVFVGDQPVPEPFWDRVRPRAGQQVTVRVVPGGGGGKKNPLAVVLSIALLATAPYLGVQLSGALNLGGMMGRAGLALATAAVTVAGQLAISAIAPPPRQDLSDLSGAGKEAPTYSLSGGRNRLAPYDAVPQVLGRHLIVPPYGAPPYTELVGQDQYMRFLFLLGYGPVLVEEPKIGETSIWALQGVEYELRQGFADDEPLTLFPGSVFEDTSNLPVLLTETDGWQQRTTLPDIDEISFDLSFQSLVRYDEQGNKQTASVEVAAEYRAAGSADPWTPIAPNLTWASSRTVAVGSGPGKKYLDDSVGYVPRVRKDRVVIDRETGALSIVQGVSGGPPPTPQGKYSVAVITREGSGRFVAASAIVDERDPELVATGADNFLASVEGGSSRYVTVAPGSFASAKLIVSAAKAAAVRYGQSVDVEKGQYEVRWRRVTPDSTSDKVFDEVYVSVLRSIRHTDPVTLAGMAKIALRVKASEGISGVIDQFSCVATTICPSWTGSAWEEQPTANPAALGRHILQGPANKRPRADAQLDLPAWEELAEAADRGGWRFGAVVERATTVDRLLGDVLSVARASRGKKDGLDTVIRDRVQTVHWGHLTPRNSWGVQGEKTFAAPPHALRVRFVNEASGWRQDEIVVYDDGFDEASASRFETLDLYGVTSADQAWSQGRFYLAQTRLRPEIHSRNVDFEHLTFTRGDFIRVTDDVAMHGIASGRIKSVATDAGGSATAVTLDERVPMEAGATYAVRIRRADGSSLYRAVQTVAGETDTLTFAVPVDPVDLPEPDDLVSFGETDRESAEKLVIRIEMLPDLAARVYYVDLANEIHSADAGPIPPYDPQITVPADLTRAAPPAPRILGVLSDDRALVRRADGTIISRILVGVAASAGAMRTRSIELHYRRQGQADWIALPAVESDGSEIAIEAVEDGVTYDLRVRALSPYGVPSAWVSAAETVVGKTSPPPAPDVFLVRAQPDGTREFTFSLTSAPVDLDGYLIRYKLGAGHTWDDMTPLHTKALKSSPWETNQLAAGSYTFACKTVDTTGNPSASAKYIELTVPDPRLAGVLDMFSEFQLGWPGAKTACFVTTEGYLSAGDADTWADKSAWGDWSRWNQSPLSPITYVRQIDLGAPAAFIPLVTVTADGAVTIEERHSVDGLSWSAWAAAGTLLSARYIEIRVTVAGSYPLIREMMTLLSATPKTEDLEDLSTAALAGAHRLGAGDVRLPITESFAVIRRVDVALQNVGAGWSWELIDKDTAPGPRIKIYNSAGAPADATIDATVRGI